MTVPALWTKHRPLALTIARGYFWPGAERQDVEQEALIALWVACRDYRPDHGTTFKTFAELVINRRLSTALRMAQAGKHEPLNTSVRQAVSVWDGEDVVDIVETIPHLHQVADHVETREQLASLARAIEELAPLERRCVLAIANGSTYAEIGEPFKRIDNALCRARLKLKAAA